MQVNTYVRRKMRCCSHKAIHVLIPSWRSYRAGPYLQTKSNWGRRLAGGPRSWYPVSQARYHSSRLPLQISSRRRTEGTAKKHLAGEVRHLPLVRLDTWKFNVRYTSAARRPCAPRYSEQPFQFLSWSTCIYFFVQQQCHFCMADLAWSATVESPSRWSATVESPSRWTAKARPI